jgi:aspartate/methionine/tyrosine aminotransferase
VEINSSFYRPHRPSTYERWAASVPASFRFSVKVPRSITHERRLADADALLDAFLAEHAATLEWVRPRGAPIGFPRVLDRPAEQLAGELLRRESTLILPGAVYGHRDEHFRIGFGRRDLPEALERLARVL